MNAMSLHLTQSTVYTQATTSEPEHCYHSVRGSLSGCAAWEINCLNCENKGKKLFNYSSARSPDSCTCHQHGLAFHTITISWLKSTPIHCHSSQTSSYSPKAVLISLLFTAPSSST